MKVSGWFSNNLLEIFLGWLYQMVISKKIWPPEGRAFWRFNFCLMAVERYWPFWASCCYIDLIFFNILWISLIGLCSRCTLTQNSNIFNIFNYSWLNVTISFACPYTQLDLDWLWQPANVKIFLIMYMNLDLFPHSQSCFNTWKISVVCGHCNM